MSSSLLLQQSPACLVHPTWIGSVMGGKWLYSCCPVRYYLQDLFNIARGTLVQLPSGSLSIRLASVHVVHPNAVFSQAAAVSILLIYIYIYIINIH